MRFKFSKIIPQGKIYAEKIDKEYTDTFYYSYKCFGVVLVGDKDDLECMMRKLKGTYEKWGLDMNLNKTKYLRIGEMYRNLKLDKNSEIESCQEYKYLGVFLY
jgi:hypothetical protein